ncbi:MAG: hypothetical protein CMJ83_15130 [Planctomycetes bacterium]|nr:hypothetical protein [Planctomycetota bacterium]
MLRSVGSNWVRVLLTAASALVLQPYLLFALGEQVNIWAVISSYTTVLTLLAFGIPMASSKIFATAVAKADHDELNAAIGSSASLYVLVGLAALVIGGISFLIFDASFLVRNWPDDLGDARMAFAVTVVFMALNFFAQLPYGVMTAHQDFVVANVIASCGLALKLASTIWLLSRVPSLTVLACITLGVLALEFCVAYLIMRRRYPYARIRFSDRTREQIKKVVGFSAWVLLLNLGIKLAFALDGVVLSWFGEWDDPWHYEAANKPMVMFIEFLVAIGAVAMPKVAQLLVSQDMVGIRAIYLQWTKVAFSLTLMAGLYLLVLGPEFLGAWMDEESYRLRSGPLLQVLMVSCFVFMPVRGVSLGVLIGLGKARTPGLLFLAMGIFNLALSLILVHPLGVMGVALGTAIPNVLFGMIIAGVVCKDIDLARGRFLWHVGGRAAIGAVPVVGALLAMKFWIEPRGRVMLVALGVAHCAIFALIWAGFVYRGDPHIDVTGRLRRILGK